MRTNKFIIIVLNIVLSLVFACMFSLIVLAILERFLDRTILVIIYLLLSILLAVLIGIKMWKKFFKTLIWKLTINDRYIIFQSEKENITIDITKIISVNSIINANSNYSLSFKYINDIVLSLKSITKSTYKFIAKRIPLVPPIPKKIKEKRITTKQFLIQSKEKVIKNIDKIITAIIGLGVSILSISLYVNYKTSLFVIVFCSIICFIFGVFEFYFVYVRKSHEYKDKITQIVLSILFTLIYHVIVFVIMVVLCCVLASKPFTVDLLFYTIFSYPSFVIVIAIIMLLMVGASYA